MLTACQLFLHSSNFEFVVQKFFVFFDIMFKSSTNEVETEIEHQN